MTTSRTQVQQLSSPPCQPARQCLWIDANMDEQGGHANALLGVTRFAAHLPNLHRDRLK